MTPPVLRYLGHKMVARSPRHRTRPLFLSTESGMGYFFLTRFHCSCQDATLRTNLQTFSRKTRIMHKAQNMHDSGCQNVPRTRHYDGMWYRRVGKFFFTQNLLVTQIQW